MHFYINGKKVKYLENSTVNIDIPSYNGNTNNSNPMDNQTTCPFATHPLTTYSVLLGILLTGLIIYLLCIFFFKKNKKHKNSYE
jgi:cytosine/uracil/thiamine/allantoin permease